MNKRTSLFLIIVLLAGSFGNALHAQWLICKLVGDWYSVDDGQGNTGTLIGGSVISFIDKNNDLYRINRFRSIDCVIGNGYSGQGYQITNDYYSYTTIADQDVNKDGFFKKILMMLRGFEFSDITFMGCKRLTLG